MNTKRSFSTELNIELELTARVAGIPVPLSVVPASLLKSYFQEFLQLSAVNPQAIMEAKIVEIKPIDTQHQEFIVKQTLETQPAFLSWHEKASIELGRPATGAELYEKMVEMGFESKANDPKDSVRRALRENPKFIRVGKNSEGITLWVARGVNSVVKEYPESTQKIKEGKDYAIEVLGSSNKVLSTREISSEMIKAGWPNNSASENLRIKATRALLSRHKNIFLSTNGFWTLLSNADSNKPSAEDLDDAEARFLAERGTKGLF